MKVISTVRKGHAEFADGGVPGLLGAMARKIAKPVARYLVIEVLGRTPKRIGVYNGVPVRDIDILANSDVRPTYEQPLIKAIRNHTPIGASVVVIGGGLGVSTVTAANCVGAEGDVVVFEAARSQIGTVEETIRLNRVSDIASVRHAVVQTPGRLYGDKDGATELSSSELPACDVLAMDCDGAESDILSNLEINPSVIIVETHDVFGSPESRVRDELDRLGYEVVDRGVEVEEKGVFILVAVPIET